MNSQDFADLKVNFFKPKGLPLKSETCNTSNFLNQAQQSQMSEPSSSGSVNWTLKDITMNKLYSEIQHLHLSKYSPLPNNTTEYLYGNARMSV